ncbi:tyrosine-type recombinase/integrase [Streptomyces sp. MPA0124]|uniref:tyrosine-type recombinase/integrase n=1 Tax=Streptomyces sp. MPA0124 TaxID=3378069 RepID=UPI003851C0D1
MVLVDGRSPTVTDLSCQFVFNQARKLLYSAITAGHAERLGIDTGFLTAIPFGGTGLKQRSRNPFSDDVARALTDETNLRRLEELDLNDRGLRDIWETIVATGRRCSEVVGLRLDSIGRYRGLAMLWHDQTKVGNYNEGIRIPEPIYQRLDTRRTKTLQLFEKRYGRTPAAAERPGLALFPSRIRNPNGRQPISYGHFNQRFKTWIADLDLGGAYVAHQARHTLATNLLRAGATLTHIRRYLGQLSERMAEHYVKITNSDLEDVLNTIWVAGPGAPTQANSSPATPPPSTARQPWPWPWTSPAAAPPPTADSAPTNPSSTADPAPGNSTARTATTSSSPAQTSSTGDAKPNSGDPSPRTPPTMPPPTTSTPSSNPPPRPSKDSSRPWPPSASSTKPSPSTCGAPRTTSTAPGAPLSAPAISHH